MCNNVMAIIIPECEWFGSMSTRKGSVLSGHVEWCIHHENRIVQHAGKNLPYSEIKNQSRYQRIIQRATCHSTFASHRKASRLIFITETFCTDPSLRYRRTHIGNPFFSFYFAPSISRIRSSKFYLIHFEVGRLFKE